MAAPSQVGRGSPQRRQISLRANWWSWHFGHFQSSGKSTVFESSTRLEAPQRWQWLFLANTNSPQVHVQSPGRPPEGAAAADASAEGLATPHLRQEPRLPKTKSPQAQVQSPEAGGTAEAHGCVGLAVPHFQQLALLAKTRPLQPGQVQSPTAAELEAPVAAELGIPVAAELEVPVGRLVPHFRQVSLLAKTRPWQPGQIQSPGRPAGGALPALGPGLAAPQRRHWVFLPNWKSPQLVQFQSMALDSAK
mmetsp:Transcript_27427/g.65178  ORF Transcript_27427/g.65178 Transcript_27427/m.65178 type:complete len:249 (+) Transcript_27427:908-1654(+)